MEAHEKSVRPTAGVPPPESSSHVGGEEVAGSEIPCVVGGSGAAAWAAADSAVRGWEDAAVRGACISHGAGAAPAQDDVCMVGGSPPAWWSRSVPRVINPRASAMVCATNGGPGVVEARQQQDAMARSDRVLRKNIEREEEVLGPKWPAPTGLQTALRTKNSRLPWEPWRRRPQSLRGLR